MPLVYHTKRSALARGLRQHRTDIVRFSHGAPSAAETYRSAFIPGPHDVCVVFEAAKRVTPTTDSVPPTVEAPRDSHSTALAAAALGYRCVPRRPGTKVPAVAWKRWQIESPPPGLLRRWLSGTRHSVALLADGLVVFDCDIPAETDRVLVECGDTPYRLRTPGGGVRQAYRKRRGVAVKNGVKVRGRGIDLRTDGGLALLPPSSTDKGRTPGSAPG